jgi:orotate phosphoribosyltransferase
MNDALEWRLAPGLELPPEVLNEVVDLSVRNSEYNLTAGGHGTYFFDIDLLLSTSNTKTDAVQKWLQLPVQKIRELVEHDGYTALAFIEGPRGPVGALSMRVALGQSTQLPTLIVRPYKRLLTQAIKPFSSLKDERLLVVSDVATSGTSIVDAVRVLWKVGARRVGALAFLDREEGAEQALSRLGIEFHYVMRPPMAHIAV